MSCNQIVSSNAERLGIRDKQAIGKADEYMRLLNMKPIGKSISDAAKAVICLDLSMTELGLTFEKNTALKITGLRKSIYQNQLNNIQKVLNLDKPLSISEVCVQLSCTAARKTAEAIFENYRENDLKDISHPQYTAAAVYTACSLENIKVEKSRLVTMSRLKNVQWKELVEEFSKFTQTRGFVGEKSKKKANTTTKNLTQDSSDAFNTQDIVKNADEPEIEEYEVWKERILSEAFNNILKASRQSKN